MPIKQKKTKEWKRRLKRIKERERTKAAINASRERLRERVKNFSSQKDYELRIDQSNPQKMSEVIIEYAQPLLDAAQSPQNQRKSIAMAITFWNIALLSDEEQKKFIKDFINTAKAPTNNEEWSGECEQVVTYFIERKTAYYPHINRMILDFECIETPQGLHLNVVSKEIQEKADNRKKRQQ